MERWQRVYQRKIEILGGHLFSRSFLAKEGGRWCFKLGEEGLEIMRVEKLP